MLFLDDQNFSFTPQQAHIFGGQSIFLSFMNWEVPLGRNSYYFVIFNGSNLRHITSTKILNPYTLQAVIPDHDKAELVQLAVYQYTGDGLRQLAKDSFLFTSDSSEFLAQQLVANALDPKALQNLESIYNTILNVPLSERRGLDTRLSTSCRNLTRITTWLLAYDQPETPDGGWNLLHFSAKYTLCQLAEFFLSKPGASVALQSMDQQGRTPLDIAIQTNQKKLIEILSRVPCDENSPVQMSVDFKRPNVKRHKLGTTTISNLSSESPDDIEKDLMLLKELASASIGTGEVNNCLSKQTNEEFSPLSESLKKLQEINEEIRRLRSLSYKENMDQYEREINGETSTGFFTDSKVDFKYDDEDEFVDIGLIETNKNNDFAEEKISTIPSIYSLDNFNERVCELSEMEKDSEIDELTVLERTVAPKVLNVCVTPPPVQEEVSVEGKLSCVSVEHEEVSTCETVEKLEAMHEVVPQVTESAMVELISSDTSLTIGDEPNQSEAVAQDPNSLMPGDLNFKLESVTEETEEELKADGSGRSPAVRRHTKSDSLVTEAQTQSLTDLPPLPSKRVGILKRSGAKKDRPLSDSFENLKMVEKQGIVELFQGPTGIACPTALVRGHSLDALMNDHEDGYSSLSMSQFNLLGEGDSQDSLTTSDCESPKSRSRSNSEKISLSSQRASSSLSLNDVYVSRTSSASSTEDLSKHSKKTSSLFSRFHGKKAKSMSSLEFVDTSILSEEERRKTIAGDLSMLMSGKNIVDSERLIQYVGPTEVKKSISSLSVDKAERYADKENSDRRMFTQSDDDTDDGASCDNVEKQSIERKTSNEDKSKRRFGILRSKPKDKEKEKKKKKHLQAHLKPDLATQIKQENKAVNFLSKRGSSFRQNFSKASELKASEKPMFSRGTSNNGIVGNKLRTSDRRSPVVPRKISSTSNEHMTENNIDIDAPLNLLQARNLSSSRTSIDSFGLFEADDTDYSSFQSVSLDEQEYDSDLDASDVPETWSELVDKKVQRKMHAKDIKRQDVIYELIQTEAQYVRTLYVMKKIYMRSMVTLNFDEQTIRAIFPQLDELIDLNGGFLKAMKNRQEESTDKCIESIGDILYDFFGGEKGERLKIAYGIFCSQHLEAVARHKELLKLDKKFAACMKKCLLNERSRRLTLPECITYVTIRMTKYPLLIEAIIKATKESKPDYEPLKKSLNLVKEVLVAVDDAVNDYEQQKELEILKKNLDRKNVVEIKIGQFKSVYRANKLFHRRSKLMCDKKTQLKGKSKTYETRMVVLAEKIIFFQDNGAKLQLLQVDNKAPVLSLKNLMVREVATDNKALFLVSNSKDAAQIYEIVCDSYKDKKEYMAKLRDYIKKCPEGEVEITDNEEETRREEEEKMGKLREVIESLQTADDKISKIFNEKNRLVSEMREMIEGLDDLGPIKVPSPIELKPIEVTCAREVLEHCISEVNHLSSQISLDATQCSPSPSPVPTSTSFNSLSNPKRSETFSSFEPRMKQSYSSGSVNRSVSQKSMIGRPNVNVTETDSGKPRRQSQLLTSVLGRTKTMGSQEDLTSISSLASAVVQIQTFQSLKDNLSGLVDVTNKQDSEIARMRLELQESRNEVAKLRTERKDLEERSERQQKDNERSIRQEAEKYAKLAREFKRTTEKLKQQIEDKNNQYQTLLEAYNAARPNQEETVYL